MMEIRENAHFVFYSCDAGRICRTLHGDYSLALLVPCAVYDAERTFPAFFDNVVIHRRARLQIAGET